MYLFVFRKMRLVAFTVLAGVLCISATVNSEADPFRKRGSTAVLSPGPVAEEIIGVTWKHGSDVAVEYIADEVVFNHHFEDRCEFNSSTGNLKIKNLTGMDSGIYTAEVNGKVRSTIEIRVISPVPTPVILTKCNAEMTYCVVTCEGKITADMEPVEYFWKDLDMIKREPRQIIITKERLDSSVSCVLENPVSFEFSKRVKNPLTTWAPDLSILVIMLAAVVVVLSVVIVVVFVCRKRRNVQKSEEEGAGMLQAIKKTEDPPAKLSNGETFRRELKHTGTSQTNTTPEGAAMLQTNEKTEETLEVHETPMVGQTSDVSREMGG
ncbi:uncharacterized protein [Leuresthes tenuis]|uniref:uncharacterized protein n=1 Tax=Leuresthes tenuis TaxID=355514 RepID=UPI003B5084D3